MCIKRGTWTEPTSHTLLRSFRSKSTIIKFSARFFTSRRSSSATFMSSLLKSIPASSLSWANILAVVPLIGFDSTWYLYPRSSKELLTDRRGANSHPWLWSLSKSAVTGPSGDSTSLVMERKRSGDEQHMETDAELLLLREESTSSSSLERRSSLKKAEKGAGFRRRRILYNPRGPSSPFAPTVLRNWLVRQSS